MIIYLFIEVTYSFYYMKQSVGLLLVSLTFVRWLKSHWTILSEGKSEIKEDAALLFGQSIMAHKHTDLLKSHIKVSCSKLEM